MLPQLRCLLKSPAKLAKYVIDSPELDKVKKFVTEELRRERLLNYIDRRHPLFSESEEGIHIDLAVIDPSKLAGVLRVLENATSTLSFIPIHTSVRLSDEAPIIPSKADSAKTFGK